MMTTKRVDVGESNRRILEGEDDLVDWDDEELWRGRRRDKAGTWRGRPPTLVPYELHKEMARRKFTGKAYEVLNDVVVEAMELVAEIIRDPDADLALRMRAVEFAADRIIGKPESRAQVEVSVTRPWEDAIIAALVPTDADVIDAEVIREDPDGIEWDDER